MLSKQQEADLVNLVGVLSSLKVLKSIESMKADFSQIVGQNLFDIVKQNSDYFKGPHGPRGMDGMNGPSGRPGPHGPEGPRGISLKDVEIINNGTDELNFVFHFSDGSAKQFAKNIKGERGEKGSRGQRGKEGPQGVPGMVGPRGLVGEPGASIQWKGIWQPGQKYFKNDIVSYNNALYIALQDNPKGNPMVSKDWEKIISLENFSGIPRMSGGGAPAPGGTAIIPWVTGVNYTAGIMVYTGGKIYLALADHVSDAIFYVDYRAGLWQCLSDSFFTQPLINAATDVLITALAVIPPISFPVMFVDILCQRKTDLTTAFYKLTITLVWDGVQWVKNESSKTYFPGAPDDIRFNITTQAGTNFIQLTYTTPNMVGIYDPVFSKLSASVRGVI